MRHTTNIESPINVGFESGLRLRSAHSQTAVNLNPYAARYSESYLYQLFGKMV